jgi:hypothetical protein
VAKIEQYASALDWARAQVDGDFEVSRLPQAASQRIYYRLQQAQRSWVLMDAAAEIESAKQTARLTELFASLQVRVPQIIAAALSRGWLLLEDLGADRLLERLRAQPELADTWYQAARRVLLHMQTASVNAAEWPVMDQAFAKRESMRFITDFVPAQPAGDWDMAAMEMAIDELADLVAAQPQGLSHRDFHAANLMCMADGELGVLDFQSAFYAPLVYDAVSLLRDCYIDWPSEQVMHWLQQFYEASPLWQQHYVSFAALKQDFDCVSLQRHLKCAGLFVALTKAGQMEYAAAIPRTVQYLHEVCQQDERWSCFLPVLESCLSSHNY